MEIKNFEDVTAGDVIVKYQPRKRARWITVTPSTIDVIGVCEKRSKAWGKCVKWVQIRESDRDEYIAEGERYGIL